MDKDKAIFLKCIDRYLTGVASRSEQLFVEEYYERMSKREESIQQLSPEIEKTLKETIHQNILNSIHGNREPRGFRIWNFKVLRAAAVLIAASVIAIYFFLQNEKTSADRLPIAALDITPGGNRALLTLSDGREINLDDASIGQIAEVSGSKVVKTSDGQLVYEFMGSDPSLTGESSAKFNTISTPRGGQYQVVLPDGTKVWLNSASSIHYPSLFSGAERYVEISGEAYFEVAPDRRRPFIVKSAKQKIEVLGTHFNVSAYRDEENTSTTLIEGSVRIYPDKAEATVLKPSEQAVLRNNELLVTAIQGDDATAWKNGRFVFNNTDIQVVMRSVSRWYDVDIEYENGVPNKTIGGDISKFENISQLLEVLEATGGIHFRREGRRIIVM